MHYDYCKFAITDAFCPLQIASQDPLAQGASKRFQEHVYWPDVNTHGFSQHFLSFVAHLIRQFNDKLILSQLLVVLTNQDNG